MPVETPLTPREVFDRFVAGVLQGFPHDGPDRSVEDSAPDDSAPEDLNAEDLNAEDVVVEWPFNPPGRPRRVQGRAEINALISAGRTALPVRFEDCRNVTVHETADPEVIIAEYELAGTVTTTGRPASAPFVMVLRVRDGKIVHCREYQNVLAMAAALGQIPALLAAFADPETTS